MSATFTAKTLTEHTDRGLRKADLYRPKNFPGLSSESPYLNAQGIAQAGRLPDPALIIFNSNDRARNIPTNPVLSV